MIKRCPFSADVLMFAPTGSGPARRDDAGHHIVIQMLAAHPPITKKRVCSLVKVYRHKYTWCKIVKTWIEDKVRRVSCITILDDRGSNLEAQKDFGGWGGGAFPLQSYVMVILHIVSLKSNEQYRTVLLPHLLAHKPINHPPTPQKKIAEEDTRVL